MIAGPAGEPHGVAARLTVAGDRTTIVGTVISKGAVA